MRWSRNAVDNKEIILTKIVVIYERRFRKSLISFVINLSEVHTRDFQKFFLRSLLLEWAGNALRSFTCSKNKLYIQSQSHKFETGLKTLT